MATEIEANINVTGGDSVNNSVNKFKELKNSLREAISELAGLQEGTAEYVAQAQRVGQIRDQVNALNDSIAAVSGSPIENLSGSFGLLSGQVSNLDFDGAASSLAGFAGQIKNFSFKDLIAGAKTFTSTLGTLGKALLSNPLFLIIGLITGIVAAVVALKDKIKILSDAFDAVGSVIDTVVQAGKDFLDFLGLSNFAIEENAQKTIDAAKAAQEATEARYDAEIKIANAAGKDTAKLEKEKQIAVLQSLKTQLDAIKSVGAANGEFTEEQIKQIQEIGKAAMAAQTEIAANDAKVEKEKADKAKKSADEQIAANKALRKQIEDEQIAAIKGDEERATAKAVKDKERRDEDIKASKASAAVKAEALKASELQLNTDILAINKTFNDKRIEEEKRLQAEKEKAEKEALDKKIAGLEYERTLDKAKSDYQLQLLEDKKNKDAEVFAIQQQQLQQDYEKALEVARLKGEDTSVIEQEYATKKLALEQDTNAKIAADRAAARDGEIALAVGTFQSLQALSDAIFEIKGRNLKKGSKEEEEAAKKQFNINKALGIATATMQGIQAVLAAYSSGSAIPIIGAVAGPAFAVLAGITAAANIAKIAATKFQGGGSGGGTGGGSVGASGTGAAAGIANLAPTSTQFNPATIGQAGANAQSQTQGQTAAQEPVKVFVLESDITKTQNKVKTVENQASF